VCNKVAQESQPYLNGSTGFELMGVNIKFSNSAKVFRMLEIRNSGYISFKFHASINFKNLSWSKCVHRN
jgi:hypothetical protein